jgi:hypothetical protein
MIMKHSTLSPGTNGVLPQKIFGKIYMLGTRETGQPNKDTTRVVVAKGTAQGSTLANIKVASMVALAW